MKIIDVEQGSPEWWQARLGMPTASAFHRVMTDTTRKFSKASEGYLYELVAEHLLGEPLDGGDTGFTLRGKAEEKFGRLW